MLLITGAYGFIGSCLVSELNKAGRTDLIISDDFSKQEKEKNLIGKEYFEKVDRNQLFNFLSAGKYNIEAIIHIGARTDTAEFDYKLLNELNLFYTQELWKYAVAQQIPLIYASSAATYGNGELGYDDAHNLPFSLKPLNPYGESKNEFDKWALQQPTTPPFWAGLKFFNVYGPNEYHKGRMASVIFHSYNQILKSDGLKLFKSHKEGIANGEQKRDFVYVKDLLKVILFLLEVKPQSGLYNLGTGVARSFNDLANAVFLALNKAPNIEYIDTPIDIRDKYQYFTQANMAKLRTAGFDLNFTSLEDGVTDYITNYLSQSKYL